MGIDYRNNPELHDHLLKEQRLVFEFSITANATPASKIHISDIPGVAILRTQGKTAEADAVESITWTTPDDENGGNSVFGLLMDLGDAKARKVHKVMITEKSNVSASEVVTGPNGAASYKTAAGNIGIEIAATGLRLDTESPTFLVEIEYFLVR